MLWSTLLLAAGFLLGMGVITFATVNVANYYAADPQQCELGKLPLKTLDHAPIPTKDLRAELFDRAGRKTPTEAKQSACDVNTLRHCVDPTTLSHQEYQNYVVVQTFDENATQRLIRKSVLNNSRDTERIHASWDTERFQNAYEELVRRGLVK